MTIFRSRRTLIAIAAAATVLVAGAMFSHVRRDREWAHGGDQVTFDAEVAITTAEDFDREVVRLGAPPGEATRWEAAEQTVVARVRWSGLPESINSLQVIALDKRVSPPKPLIPDGGWNSAGGTGSGWEGAYEPLAEHYDWLRRVAGPDAIAAVDAPGAGSGTVTAWFRQQADATRAGRDDIVLAVFSVDDDGEVRWARRIFG
ncbi:hypothetical protein AB0368_00655 [Actinoplanes sp. NPDC051475]|uniref:hypothetical protein n=1 Tax=Actinoplanes sp. NPDC051475 TaxID=3157225 RepID=UPI00344BDD8C